MAKLSSKQLNTKLTGSYTFSGSSHSFIGDITADNNISASVSSTGSFGAISVAGMSVSNLVDVSSSISTRLSTEETNVDNLQTDSGSFSTRITTAETELSNTLVSSSAQIASDISGSFTDASSSFSTRLSTEETNVDNLQTDSGSFSTRITNLKTDSGSFSTRVTTNTSTGSILAGTGNIQGLGTTNNVQFNHITASGNISSSGTVFADKFQSTGGDSDGILFTDDLNITGSITVTGNVSGSSTSTGSFGYLEGISFGTQAQANITGSFSAASASFATTTTENQARLDTIQQFTGSYATTGSNTFIGDQIVSGSVFLTGSNHISGTIKVNAEGVYSSSTAIFTNNITNGYPTSNPWGSNLEGSYFNNFNNTTHVSEILRFMSGVMSHSLDVADAAPNTKTFASVDTNDNNLGGTDTVDGYLPQSYDSTNATMKYLVTKDWVTAGEQIFQGITQYHDNGGTYFIDFDSNSGGSTSVSSSVDTELFGLGGLTSGGPTDFKVRVHATHSFSDTGSVSSPNASSNTHTTQSKLDLTLGSFGTSDGLTLTKIATNVPAVIPAAFQDGKFVNVGGTSQLSGSLSRKYHASKGLFTSVSSSGYYRWHDLKVGIASGSGNYQFVNGTTKSHFWAPIDQISSDIGTNSLSIAQVTQSYLTAASRSLSGAPYLTGATYHISASVRGLFDPMYAASSTLVDDNIGSVGVGSVGGSGIDDVSTSGGTIQTANAVFASDSGSVRATSAVPTRTDVVRFNATYTLSGTTGDNIQQSSTLTDETFTVGIRARNRASSQSTLQTETIFYHSASLFGQPASSGSMGVYQRTQGYDGGSLTGTTELFSGEDFRIKLNNNVLGFNGDAFTTTYNVTRGASALIGQQDLQVKPGFLVEPGGSYRYWYPANYGTGSYKYYIRRFQTSGTKTSMTVNLNNTTLVNWKATTDDRVACALIFKSAASGSGTNSELSRARIYDPSELTANLISSSVAHQTDFHLNPFTDALDLYGNTGGSLNSGTYTVPIRNADGIFLDNNDTELYVVVRYAGDPTPIDDITLTFS